MSAKLAYFQFQHLQNPFGILFQPKALEQLVIAALEGKKYTEDEPFFHNEHWHSFEAHSSLSHPNKEELLRLLNQKLQNTANFLEAATHVFITLGTAWAYRFKETQTWVANCHKVPQQQFDKVLLSVETIAASLRRIRAAIQARNPKTQLVFTVSPVRHLKDGFVENQRSKAHLLAAVHEVISDQNGFYFPAYEIVMDELRDYRFYAEDMVHPNSVAIDYIWKKFAKVWVDAKAAGIMKEVDAIRKGQQHRPFNATSAQHQEFRAQLEERIDQLQAQYAHMRF